MNVIGRARNLLLEPRRTWMEIAGEGDAIRPLLTRYLPTLLLPALGLFLILLLVLLDLKFQTNAVQHYAAGPDGRRIIIGTVRPVTLSGGRVALVALVLIGLATAAMYALILANARRFGAPPNRIAALKLLAYAWTPGLIGTLLFTVPLIGIGFAIAGLIATVVLFRLGAPILLPPHPGEEARFGRAIAARAIMLAAAVPVAFIAIGLQMLSMLRS